MRRIGPAAGLLVAILAGPDAAAPQPAFVDVTSDVGLDFVHDNGASGAYHFPEIAGSGVGLFDYDGDGDLDLYLVQGADLDRARGPSSGGRLYRNDLTLRPDGSRELRFRDVTRDSGILAEGFGMGVAAGDVDNDGDVDLYLTFVGSNQLWRNEGDGGFTDVTAEAGVGDSLWGTSATFFDYDRDGWLDLFATNYVAFRETNRKDCAGRAEVEDYCGPASYRAEPDRLWRNRGDGRFEDVTGPAGMLAAYGSGLGVVAADFDGDGWTDLFVANDQRPDRLWHNRADGTFEDVALIAGCALNRSALATSSMGVVAEDFDEDGDEDLFVTNLAGETHTLFDNDGQGWFLDRTTQRVLASPSVPDTGFGVAAIDFDNDGWQDLVIANGAVTRETRLARDGHAYPYGQPNRLFRNRDGERFEDLTASAGAAFQLDEISRGLAWGDLDQDGDVDVVMSNASGPARVLLNQWGARRPWVGLRLLGREGRDAEGAAVRLTLDDGRVLHRRVHRDGSYCSAGDPRIVLGLGEGRRPVSLAIDWPSGLRERHPAPPAGRYSLIREGSGNPVGAESR